ncbi:MAG: hypothetical protein IPQ08_06275 [Chitinophagaceae bacterium]|nr:hypothetical protein [Chitinophagaceae bacterium]
MEDKKAYDEHKNFDNIDISPESKLWCTVLLNLMLDILSEKQTIKKIYDNNRLQDFEKEKLTKIPKYNLHLLMQTLNSKHIQDVCSWVDIDHGFYQRIANNEELINATFSTKKMLAACRFDIFN